MSSPTVSQELQGFELSPQQRRLWQLQQESPAYQAQCVIGIEGSLEAGSVAKALERLTDRHEALRIAFHRMPGIKVPYQVLGDALWDLSQTDLCGASPADQQQELAALLQRQRQEPFDCEKGPLLRAVLLRLSPSSHLLCLNLPSLCADAWSLEILFRQIGPCYAAVRRGEGEEAEEALQYTQFSEWQNSLLQEEEAAQEEAFWERFSEGSFGLGLPFAFSPSAWAAFQPASYSWRAEGSIVRHLAQSASRNEVEAETFLLGCWQALLRRLTNREGGVTGWLSPGREHEALHQSLGLFARYVPIESLFKADRSLVEGLTGLQEALAEAREMQDYFVLGRNTAADACFEAAFQCRQMPPDYQADGLRWSLNRLWTCSERYQLQLSCASRSDGLALQIDYDPDCFQADDIERLASQFEALLGDAVQNPQRRVSELEVLGRRERRLLLEAFNDTQADVVEQDCIHHCFEAQAERTPGRVAVFFEDSMLSYGGLNARANRLARRLVRAGMKPGQIAALLLGRSPEVIVSLLAALKAGGAYLPVNLMLPREGIGFVLRDCGPAALISMRHWLQELPEGPAPALLLDEEEKPESGSNLKIPSAASQMAYVLYTSGSTGRPKGVAVEHRQLLNYAMAVQRRLELPEMSSYAMVSTFAADLGNTALFPALLLGGCLHLIAEERASDPGLLADYCSQRWIDCLKIVPSHLEALLALPDPSRLLPRRRLVLGGEASGLEFVEQLQRLAPQCKILNHYGPTEATVGVLTWPAENKWRDPRLMTLPVGRPLANCRAYLLDDGLRPVPSWTAGELLIGGAQLARGYLKRPGLTASRFIPDPFAPQPGGRLYRSGDLARHVPGQGIEFLGRTDHQVKLRGFRIELGEIEQALLDHPGVRRAAVLLRQDQQGDSRLAAYLVAEHPQAASSQGESKGPELDAGQLRRHLRKKLPEYMVPASLAVLKSLPLTPNGKVDRQALLEMAPAEKARRYVAPSTPTQELLAGIFSDVLSRRKVGIRDNFFDLGGHSLLATQVMFRIRQAFEAELPLQLLFEVPTVEGLAQRIDQQQPRAGAGLPPLKASSRIGEMPLSFAQQRLWFLDQLEPGSPLYNVPSALRLGGQLNPAALQASFDEMVRRHEILRTSYPALEGKPVQYIHSEMRVQLPVIDLSGLKAEQRGGETGRLRLQEAERPFDLASGPLLRVRLVRLGGQDHLLLATMHHIVSDAWSKGVVVQELGALYEAFDQGRPSPLPELPLQYADFARWQRQWMEGPQLQEQISYWKEQLSDIPPLLELPIDHPRPLQPSYRGQTEAFSWPAELRRDLLELSRRSDATLFMTLIAAFQTLLARWSQQKDVCIGTPIANRTRPEIEGLIGFFVNTLVLRGDLSARPGFEELLSQVRQSCLGAYAHQDVPFEQVVEALQPQRSLSHTPLFQVVFAFQNVPLEELRLEGLEAFPDEAPALSAKFDLTLIMAEGERGLKGAVEYSADLFDRTTVQRLSGHFANLLQSIAADPGRPVWELPWLDSAQRHQVTLECNDSRSEYPRDETIPQVFSAGARRWPDRVALAQGSRQMSYRELERRSSLVAQQLRHQGLRPESRVGIFLQRSLELLPALLGSLRAGACYLPLDPANPSQRLDWMIKDARVCMILTQEDLKSRLTSDFPTSICMQHAYGKASGASQKRPNAEAGSLAYLIYTSGSTGRPKGTAVPHRAVLRLVQNTNFARLDERQAFLLLAPISFDASTFELWGSLLNGARLAIFPPNRPTLEQIGREILEQGVTTLWLTAPLFHLMAERNMAPLSRLGQLLAGGDVLSPSAVHKALKAGAARLINGYGPTENTTFTCCHSMQGTGGREASIPIGRPVANSTAYALDASLNPVPLGVSGKLFTGGDGLARGYWEQPAMTAERFIPDPFSAGRLYDTGDVVRRRWSGELEFLGRRDQQVKIRGFRIEPAEIEAALSLHPQVGEAAVLVHAQAPDEKRLAAYLAIGQATLEEEALQQGLGDFLRERLPEYMVPSAFMILPELPKTASGKLDRQALLRHQLPDQAAWAEYVAPSTAAEELLAGIWSELLGVEQVGVKHNFFQLGGHSLLATQAISRNRQAFSLELPLRALFEAPTPALLAKHIEELRRRAPAAAPRLAPVERKDEDDLPLSFAQQRLWFLDQLAPGSPLYNIPVAFRLQGRLDAAALAESLDQVVRRHEALRTIFPSRDGKPLQKICKPTRLALPAADLRSLPSGQREKELQRLAQRLARLPFDLAAGPLLRVCLIQLQRDEHAVLAAMHHIVSDGWSMRVFVSELTELYQAYSKGVRPRLPDLPIQYADYAGWQRLWLGEKALQQQLGYWKERLANAPATLELPADHPPGALRSGRSGSLDLPLGQDLSSAVQSLSRSLNATSFMTLLAAFQALLHRCSGQKSISVGTPIANRGRPEIEGLIGFFVNTLVMRADVSGRTGFRQLLETVREAALQAYANQDLPFEQLVDALQPERSLSNTPLFQVMFSFQNASLQQLDLAGLRLTPIESSAGMAKFDLTLTMSEGQQGLAGVLEYSQDLFERTTALRLAQHFARLLQGLVEEPDRPLGDAPLLSASQRQQAEAEWNDTRTEFPSDACLHQLVEEQAEKAPQAVVCQFEDWQLSFRELDRRANQIASELKAAATLSEPMVAICTRRRLELAAALLGTLKAGAAYVPLDPSYPQDRLAYMLQACGAGTLLTESLLRSELPAGAARTLLIDEDRDGLGQGPDAMAAAGQLAYLIFTSGTTGHPKAVAVSHRALVNHMLWMQRRYPLRWDRVLQKTPFSFDASVWEFWAPLLSASRLVLAPARSQREPRRLLEALNLHQITILQAVPSLLNVLLEEGLGSCTSLSRIFSGGEELPAGLHNRLLGQTRADLINLYGPSETCIDAVVWHSAAKAVQGRVPIGRPVANLRAYVLDEGWQTAPLGATAELYLGGAGLARGYFGLPRATAEVFLPNPFSPAEGGRLYKTGDRVRQRGDGCLEFLGRADQQVKIRGFRIEPGEIEAVLSLHPAVQSAAVVARQDPPGQPHLAAYLASDWEPAPQAAELEGFAREQLPDFMVPSVFVLVDEMPLNPSGKIDRKALRDSSQPILRPEYAPPVTAVEELLAGIWSDLLGAERVGREDSFFGLGGHSLLATQVISRIRGAFDVELPLRAVFEAPRLAALARRIERAQQSEAGRAAPPLRRVGRDQELPLSFAQQRLWFIDQLDPGNSLYNIRSALRLSGHLEVGALQASLNEILRRHEVLRSQFPSRDGKPLLRIREAEPLSLQMADLRALPRAARERAVRLLANQEFERPFDLARGPLVRLRLLRLEQEEHALLLTIHHIVSDGWSRGIFIGELMALYEAFSAGKPSPLPDLPLQYADFAAWQRNWLSQEVLDEQLRFWADALRGAPPRLDLPADRARPAAPSQRGATHHFVLSEELSQAIREWSQQHDATLFMTLLAAFKVLLYRYSGQADISVGTPIANRTQGETEDLIGLFVNMLVLRSDLSGQPHFDELLGRIRRSALNAFVHQHVPFERVVDAVQPERSLSHTPLFQVMFSFQEAASQGLELPGLEIESLEADIETARRDLTLTVSDMGKQLAGSWNYSLDLFEAASIETMSAHFSQLLESIMAHPEARLDELEYETEAEKQERQLRKRQRRASRRKKFQQVKPQPVRSGAGRED